MYEIIINDVVVDSFTLRSEAVDEAMGLYDAGHNVRVVRDGLLEEEFVA